MRGVQRGAQLSKPVPGKAAQVVGLLKTHASPFALGPLVGQPLERALEPLGQGNGGRGMTTHRGPFIRVWVG